MTTGVMSSPSRQKGNKKSVKHSLIPFSPLRVLQNRGYQQTAEIRNVAKWHSPHEKQWCNKKRWISSLYLVFVILNLAPTKMSGENCWVFSAGLYKSFHKSSTEHPHQRTDSSDQLAGLFGNWVLVYNWVMLHEYWQCLSPGSSWGGSCSTCHPCRSWFPDFNNEHHGRYLSLRHVRKQKALSFALLFSLANCNLIRHLTSK